MIPGSDRRTVASPASGGAAGPGSQEPGPGPGVVIGSALVWVVWLLLTAVWTPVVLLVFLVEAPFDRRRVMTGRTFRLGARLLIGLNPWWSRRIEGSPPPRSSHPMVVVCNHESLADILIIGTLPWEMKWLSKRSIFRVPFLGWMMRMAGDVPVRREAADSRAEAFERTCGWVERGVSVMIFPEGTRSRTPEMLPFRNGAFRIALATRRPVLPLAVSGTRTAIRKGSPWFGRARVTVRVLEPVPTENLDRGDLSALKARVRAAIDAARREPPRTR